MLESQKSLIRATAPILKENGVALTKHFYNRMFARHPELKNTFNLGNQNKGSQPTALAMSVLAYAEHIDNPLVLVDYLKIVAHKHCSVNVKPEEYQIVGENLLASIKEVVGEGATDELINAWAVAYAELADIMINLESNIYKENQQKNGGWRGWRKFIIQKLVTETPLIKSFYLYPEDGLAVAPFLPGQYITVRLFVPELGLFQPRQYSISTASNSCYYRISVKKEVASESAPAGCVSNLMHDLREGEIIEVTAPQGTFVLHPNDARPLVLISGGIGLTPLLSILETHKKDINRRPATWIHGCLNEADHAFKEEINGWAKEANWLRVLSFYEETERADNISVFKGKVELRQCPAGTINPQAQYFICGPEKFIVLQFETLVKLGVAPSQIAYEEFGPKLLHLG